MKLQDRNQAEDRSKHKISSPPSSSARWTFDIHVENTSNAQSTTSPLSLVPIQRGIHRIGEFTDDGDGPFSSWEMSLFRSVNQLSIIKTR
jgi:hypothetical protein